MTVNIDSLFQIGETVQVQYRRKTITGNVERLKVNISSDGVDPDFTNYLVSSPTINTWLGTKWFDHYEVHKLDCVYDPLKQTCSCHPEE